MKGSKIIYVLSLLFCNNITAQKVELYYDTINIISIHRINTKSNAIIESSKIFWFNNTFYQFNNFPFEVLKTKCSVEKKDNMFYAGFLPIINRKSIDNLNRKIKKNKYFRSDDVITKSNFVNQLTNESIEILNCLKNEENCFFLISEQKVIAAFLIIDCGFQDGVHDAIFCKDKLNTLQTPILLNVTKIIN